MDYTYIRERLIATKAEIRQHEREIREYENQAAANPLTGYAFVNYHWAKNMLPLLINRKSEYEEKLAPEKENYST